MEPSTGEILTMILNYLAGVGVLSLAAFAIGAVAISVLAVLAAASDCVPDFDDEEEL